MIHQSILSCIGNTPLVYLRRMFPQPGLDVIAKLEMLNPGGSIKDRPAHFIIEHGLREGSITASTRLIESSSGNFGIALAMTARVYGLAFTCVVDPKITPTNLCILQQLGAQIEMVDRPDDQGGYLKTRIERVQELLRDTPAGMWVNQYANQLNWQAHYHQTGAEIVAAVGRPIDVVVLSVSTAGTIVGVSRALRQHYPQMRVVAVDAVGSVIFGQPAGPRLLPGIGASRVPELLDTSLIDEVIYVDDRESAEACRSLVMHEGLLAGGSSGAVLAAIGKLLPQVAAPRTILTILPDRGERYIDTVYDDAWLAQASQPSGALS